ncbi:MAG: thioredoxin family protein [Leptospira sp.]|nr:thioredoxin family protein [Leptospira sp.]
MKYFSFFLLLGLQNIYADDAVSRLNTWADTELALHSGFFSSFVFIFIGGFLASLLPCTYPLYPITAGIIQNRAKGSKKFIHPVFYYLGLCFMYLIFGLIAGLSGGAFNQLLRIPAMNIFFGTVLFLMGLSTLEYLYIPFFTGSGFQSKSGGIFGTFLLGMGAGLLSSPCVGPIVITILLQITSSVAHNVSLYTTIIASIKMLFFGMGLGIPFLFIGAFELSLPKSGKWMRYAQFFFGLLIIYFSYGYYEKGMTGIGRTEPEIRLVALGFSLLLLCVYHIQPVEKIKSEKMKFSLLFTFAVLAILFLTKGIVLNSGSNNFVNPASGKNIEVTENLKWHRNREEAYSAAKSENKRVFIDFYADWCTNCKEFGKLAISNAELNRALSGSVLLKIYDTDPEFENFRNDKRFPELQIGLPFFVITDSNAEVIFKTTDYLNSNEMIKALSKDQSPNK